MHQDGVESIFCYISLVDAMIGLHKRNKDGACYEIRPLEAINPGIFLQRHDKWLNLFFVYGFVGEQGKVWSDDGWPFSLGKMLHFQFEDANAKDQFPLDFGNELAQRLANLHEHAGIFDHAELHGDLKQTNHDELDGCAREAVSRMPQGPRGRGGGPAVRSVRPPGTGLEVR
ncbi:MAG: hypothetical protein QM749_20235 [Aquabacterium sp.]